MYQVGVKEKMKKKIYEKSRRQSLLTAVEVEANMVSHLNVFTIAMYQCHYCCYPMNTIYHVEFPGFGGVKELQLYIKVA